MGFLCMKHSKRVFSLSSTRETGVLLSLNRRFLGAQNSNEFSACQAKAPKQAGSSPRSVSSALTRQSHAHASTKNSIRFTCLANGTKNIPFQLRSRAPISSYEAASAQRTLLENFYRGTRFDTCMRLARCAHTCIQNISKSTFFF